MKFAQILSFFALLSAAFLLSGCSTSQTAGGSQHTLILGGLYESKEAAYEPIGPLTFHTSQDEWFPNADFSGTKVTLLWGLVTFTDY